MDKRLFDNEQASWIKGIKDYSIECIIMLDKAGYIRYQNTTISKVFGYKEQSMLGKSILTYMHEKDREDIAKYFTKLTNQEVSQLQGEVRFRDASDVWRHITLQACNYDSHVLINFIDITKLKRKHYLELDESTRDPLTHLPNQRSLERYVERLLNRTKRRPFLFYKIDVHDLKTINDTLGREIGDQLLIRIVERLLTVFVKEAAFIARLEEDAFGLIFKRDCDLTTAKEIATHITATLNGEMMIKGYTLQVAVSVGACCFPEAGETFKQLSLAASQALQLAKHKKEDAFEIYAPHSSVAAYRAFTLRQELVTAIEQSQFELYYQPIVCAKTEHIVAGEALIRWIHPVWGTVSPQEFIPALEESGLIVSLGEWIIAGVCEQLSQWHQAGYGIKASLNMSPVQLFSEDLAMIVAQKIAQYQLPADALTIEITETVAITQKKVFLNTVEALRAIGVNISLDDFGTGYSSFSKILDIKPHVLKLDRSMISHIETDATSREVTAALIQLAHRLNMLVVAEGIETLEQLRETARLGCDYLQGYYFSKPVPVKEFSYLLLHQGHVTYQSKR